MAYSRWYNSDWYVFWHVKPQRNTTTNINDELLAIWHCDDTRAPVFSFKELKHIRSLNGLKKTLNLSYFLSTEKYRLPLKCLYIWFNDVILDKCRHNLGRDDNEEMLSIDHCLVCDTRIDGHNGILVPDSIKTIGENIFLCKQCAKKYDATNKPIDILTQSGII